MRPSKRTVASRSRRPPPTTARPPPSSAPAVPRGRTRRLARRPRRPARSSLIGREVGSDIVALREGIPRHSLAHLDQRTAASSPNTVLTLTIVSSESPHPPPNLDPPKALSRDKSLQLEYGSLVATASISRLRLRSLMTKSPNSIAFALPLEATIGRHPR